MRMIWGRASLTLSAGYPDTASGVSVATRPSSRSLPSTRLAGGSLKRTRQWIITTCVDGSVTGISRFYRAMSLFRQGKEEEALAPAIAAAAKMKPLPGGENNPRAGDADHDDLILWLAY